MTSSVVFRVTTKKDEVYTVRIGSSPAVGSDRYIRIDVAMAPNASADDETVEEVPDVPGPDKDEDEQQEKKDEEQQKTHAAVTALSKKLSGWTYLVSSYKAESFTTKRSDLVSEKEEKKDDEE